MAEFFERLMGALIVGLVDGTVFGLIGIGIVLIYKAQRVINFAQAEIATLAAFMLLLLHGIAGVPYGFSFILAIAVAVGVSVLIERIVIQPLRDSPDVTVFVATAGVALFIVALTFVIAGANIHAVDSLFGGIERVFEGRRFLAFFSPQRLVVLAVLVVSAASLAAFFRRSALGKAILAMSAEPFAVRLAGVNASRVSMFIWALAGLLAGLAGATSAPTGALVPGLFTFNALIPALTGAVIGGLNSLPGALAGGLIVGFIASIASTFAPAGVPAPNLVATFVILLLTLVLRPQGLLVREA